MTDTDDCGYFDTHNEWSELIQKTLSGNRRQWFIELPLTMRQAITLELRARASVLVGKMREAHMENHPNGEMFYAGHTEGPWKVIEKANDYQTTDVVVGKTIVASSVSPSDSALIADAPLLLAEVKELRRQIKVAQGVFEYLYRFHGADKSEDAHWIRWFCNMEDEEE